MNYCICERPSWRADNLLQCTNCGKYFPDVTIEEINEKEGE